MNSPMRLRVRDVATFEWSYRFRMPFRFGAITVTEGRQAIVRVEVELADGRGGVGMAAEALAAKWFDKNPALSDEENFGQLRRALANAAAAYLGHGADTPYRHYAATYAGLLEQGAREGLPPLVASFGPALLDRAIADALGRATGASFYDLVHGNVLGIAPAGLAPDLAAFDADAFLCGLRPLDRLHVRHTVGMVDPITAADLTHPLDDGLPETLEQVVAVHGHRYFKLKVGGGEVGADVDRLTRIAAVLDTIAEPYFVTLDGNEQFADADAVLPLLHAIRAEPRLRRLGGSMLYLEQPIRRAEALARDVRALDAFVPVLLDESDGEIDVFPRGRALGYRGISSKTCKGFYKSLINRMRCAAWGDGAFMSAEDLTTVAGLAVQQDLALVALLGLPHVERNGHHFVDGFTGRPEAEADAFLDAHPDLYHRHCGRVRLRIVAGQVAVGSLACPGFAAMIHPATVL